MILLRTGDIIQTIVAPNYIFETVGGSEYFVQFLSGSDCTARVSRIRVRVDYHERT